MRAARLRRADSRWRRVIERRVLEVAHEDPADAFVRARGPLRRVLAALAERFVACRGWEPLGFARLGDWARERAGLSARQVQDLARTGALLERLPLSHVHVFPYSDRPGTAACRLPAKVDGAIVHDRGRAVRQIGERLGQRFQQSQVGRVVRALTVDDGRSVVTANYLKLRLDTAYARNEWVRVEVLPHQQGHLLCG